MIGAVLKDSPLISSMFVLIYHLHPNPYIGPAIISIFFILLYIVIYTLYRIFLRKYSYMILNEKYEPPWWLPIRNSLVMRYAAETKADIEGFENFMMLRLKQDPEEMIEVVRFLGIFKSQRSRLLMMMSMWKDQSLYYDYQFYVYSRVFKSLQESPPQSYITMLDKLHRHYLVTLSLFWSSRKENKIIPAFIYATKTAFTHIELTTYIKYLSFIYQYSPYIYQSAAEISLIALGEPVKSVLFRRYSIQIADNTNTIVDPVFKNIAQFYPLTLETYHGETSNSNNESSKSGASISSSHSNLRFHIDKNIIYREESSDNSPMAMFVQKSNRLGQFSILFTLSFSIIWSVFLIKAIFNARHEQIKKGDELQSLMHHSLEMNQYLAASFVLVPIFEKYANSTQSCDVILKYIYTDISNFHLTIRDDFIQMGKTMTYAAQYLTIKKAEFPDCDEFKKVLKTAPDLIRLILDEINLTEYKFNTLAASILQVCPLKRVFIKFVMILFICSIGGTIGAIVTTLIQVNSAMRNLPDKAVEFLGSKERLGLLLFKKSLESWDLFRILFPANKNEEHHNTNVSFESHVSRNIKVAKYCSETKLSYGSPTNSHHVNLKETKLTISFIGVDQLLKPSQFALMSPYVSSTGSSDASEMSESTNDNIYESQQTKEQSIDQNSLKDMEIVSKVLASTKSEYPYFFLFIIFFFLVPWIIKYVLVTYLGIVLNFESTIAIDFLKNVTAHFESIQQITRTINEEFTAGMNFDSHKIEETVRDVSYYIKYLSPIPTTFKDVRTKIETGTSSFACVAFVFWLLSYIAVIRLEKVLKLGYESLFHFPSSYIEDINKPMDSPPEEKLPNNILEIIINSDTRYINCVSQKCYDIIGVYPIDLIGMKYDKIFQPESDNVRIFSLNMRRPKKFLESKFNSGNITRIALYDISSESTNQVALINSLSRFIPNQIARTLCESQIFPYHLDGAFMMIARFDGNEFNQAVDHIFSATHNLLQCYTKMHITKAEGSTLHFLGCSRDRCIPVMFCRDLVASSKPPPRIRADSPLKSIIIMKANVDAEINITDELYVDVKYERQREHCMSAFSAPDNTIVFIDDSNEISSMDIGKWIEVIPGVQGFCVGFNEIDKVVETLY